MKTQKTHFADNDTLKYIAELERQLAEAQRDAERYRWLNDRVSGDRYPSGVARFRLPDVRAHEGIFKGSVAEHFTNAIDAAIKEPTKGCGEAGHPDHCGNAKCLPSAKREPTLEEQILLLDHYGKAIVGPDMIAAILVSLRKLQAREAQPVQGEPDVHIRSDGLSRNEDGSLSPTHSEYIRKPDYDALKLKLQSAQRNEAVWRAEWQQISEIAKVLLERAEKAEADLMAAESNVSDLMAMAFKESPVAGGDAVSAAEDSHSAAGESPAFKRWCYERYGDVRPIFWPVLLDAFNTGAELSEARNKRLVELLKSCKQSHTNCEDTWYSCPKSEDGCANESKGTECDCGADKHNAKIDELLREVGNAN